MRCLVLLSLLCLAGGYLLPSWPATYNMSLSTMIEPCSYTGYFNQSFAAQFGLIDYDWSNAKQIWANNAPMDCEEKLVESVASTAALNPDAKIFIYRNMVKALNWFSAVRRKLDDPAYSGFFLKFNSTTPHVPRCDPSYSPPKCSVFYHDQLQTPQHGNATDPTDGHCNGPCDCGDNPCGEYLWDHRNGSMLREFLVNEVIGGPTGVDNPLVSGVNIDDFWGWGASGGPSEEDAHAVQDTGLEPDQVKALTQGWQDTMAAVQAKLISTGTFQWEWINCGHTPYTNGSTYCWGDSTARNFVGVQAQKDQCTTYMRAHCQPANASAIQQMAYSYVFTRVSMSQPLTDQGQLPAFMQDLASFLLLRGPYAWLGYTWQMCGNQYVMPPEMNEDYGQPTGECAELGDSQVFTRTWSNAQVSLDCSNYTAQIRMNDGRVFS